MANENDRSSLIALIRYTEEEAAHLGFEEASWLLGLTMQSISDDVGAAGAPGPSQTCDPAEDRALRVVWDSKKGSLAK